MTPGASRLAMMWTARLAASLLLLACLPLSTCAAELQGRVVRIVDGDTLILLDGTNMQHKTRLAGIDCPERKQPFGQRARQALSDYVFNQPVTIEWAKLIPLHTT